MDPQQKAVQEAFEALLQGSRELSSRTRWESKDLIKKIRKLEAQYDVELSKISEMASNLRQEISAMLKADRSLMTGDERRYFFAPVEKQKSSPYKLLVSRSNTIIVSALAILCLGASVFLVYINVVRSAASGTRGGLMLYGPMIVVVGGLFAGFYIILTLRTISAFRKHRDLYEERIELGRILYTTENALLRLLEFQQYEAKMEMPTRNEGSENNREDKALWSQYDSTIVNSLHQSLSKRITYKNGPATKV
jgi:hypothetical protein